MENNNNSNSFEWDRLDPAFMLSGMSFINLCAARDIVIEPLIGEVNLEKQAKFYKRCKPKSAIDAQLKLLRDKKCDFLADILENTLTDDESWTTDNIPGYCWHNWGKALKYKVNDFNIENMYPHIISILDNIGQLKSPNYLDKTTGIGYIQLPSHHVSYVHDINYINDYFKTKFERYHHV